MRLIKYPLLLLSIAIGYNSNLWAASELNVKIISRDECVFGDADLIFMDFKKDISYTYLDSKLLFEVWDEKTKKLVFKETLVDLAESDRAKDKFDSVFSNPQDGLTLNIKGVVDSVLSISICKVGDAAVDTCRNLKPQSFDQLFKEHSENKQTHTRTNKLYYFKKFSITKGKFNPREYFEDDKDLVDSMALEFRSGALVINLPKNNPAKCSLPTVAPISKSPTPPAN